jgi:hypothetical protein
MVKNFIIKTVTYMWFIYYLKKFSGLAEFRRKVSACWDLASIYPQFGK